MHTDTATIVATLLACLCASQEIQSADLDRAELLSPPELHFTVKPEEAMRVQAGRRAELICESAGIPPPLIYWTVNGERVDGDAAPQDNFIEKLLNYPQASIQHGITRSKFALPCLDQMTMTAIGGSMTVECVTENGHKKESAATVVTVEQSLTGSDNRTRRCTDMRKMNSLSKKSAIAYGEAPKISMWTDGRFELQGRNAQLYCRSTGNPPPSIQWFDQMGEPIVDGQMYRQLPNGDLLITSDGSSELSTGTYTCVAANQHGVDKIEAFFYATVPEEDLTTERR